MSKKEANTLIPELRFPDFKEDNGWVLKQLSSLGDTSSGLSGKSGDDFGTGEPYVTYMQVFNSSYVDFTQCGRVTIGENEKQNTLSRGDILFTTSSETPDEVGFASVVLNEPHELTYLNSFCFSFKPYNLDVLKPEFSRYLFRSPVYRKLVRVLAQGSTRFNISKGAFLELTIPITENPTEQQKIADCLSSLDELIDAENQKLDALKDHKKGLMQQLFPTEGKKIPDLRFPGFEGEWVEKNIGSIVDFLSGFPFKSEEISEDSNGTKLVRGINITEGKLRHSIDIDRYYLGDVSKLAKYKVETNDLVIGMDGSKVGKNSALIGDEDAGALLVQRVARLRSDVTTIQFIFQQIHSSKFHSYVDRINTSSGIPHISADQIKEFQIHVPYSKDEKQKIADCLGGVDNLITAQCERIEQLKEHKKGLMQGLFPSLNN